jgi:phosphinothricin acetyltransferase
MIRLATPDDATEIADIYRPFCNESHISFEYPAPAPEEIAARVERVNRRYAWLVDEQAGRLTGYAYASPHRERSAYRWAVEVTVYIHRDHRGRGIGRALYTDLFDRLRAQNFFKAYAGIGLPNPESQAFHESMGFTPVGIYRKIGYKLGAWWDTGWWQLSLRPEEASPAEPTVPLHFAS